MKKPILAALCLLLTACATSPAPSPKDQSASLQNSSSQVSFTILDNQSQDQKATPTKPTN